MRTLGVLGGKGLATLLNLKFEGADGSNVIEDSSLYNRTATAFGTAVLSSTNPLSGGSSLLLGTSGYVTVPNFTTPLGATFLRTIEFRMQIDLANIANNESQGVFVKGYSHGFGQNYSHQAILTRNNSGNGGVLKVWFNDGVLGLATTKLDIPIPDISQNNHIAIVRRPSGNQYIGYLNGVNVDILLSGEQITNTLGIEIAPTLYNWDTATQTGRFKGRLDNFKLSNVDRYPNNFTPPV
jgi:hypothetical protein